MTRASDAARMSLDGIEANRLHLYVGKDARIMNVAIRLAPLRSIRMVQRQMAKLGAPKVSATAAR